MIEIKKRENTEINYVSQELFARLLASENINVYHKNVQTAGFDLKNRALILPIYKDITESVYYLFVGHECSHALYTPGKKYIATCKDREKKYPYYPSILNIVEDCRVEKMIQKKFPGLPRFFSAGYKDLYARDFFKIANQKISELNLVDRINLYFKIGLNCMIDIPFADDEKIYIDRMKKIEDFDDVIKIADELAEKVKEEAKTESRKLKFKLSDGEAGEGEEIELTEQEMEELLDALKNEIGKTDKEFQQKLKKLVNYDPNRDNPEATETVYANFLSDESLDRILRHVVVDYKNVHEDIDKFYHDKPEDIRVAVDALNKFQQKNNPIIMYLIKQFEMKKSAEEFQRTLISNTGIINPNKLYSYKFNDNIFKSKDIVPEGKNHGLVMIFDCSGSMDRVFGNLLKQMMILVLFCKRMNIPFEVYGYSDNNVYSGKFEKQNKISKNFKQNEIQLANLVLKNYFSSRMKYSEFYRACVNVFCIIEYYSGRVIRHLPEQENLSGTPLNSAMAVASKLVADFRDKYKIEKVNTILLTDGLDESDRSYGGRSVSISTYRYDNSKRVLSDPATRKQYKENRNISSTIFKYFRDRSHTDLIWFYLTNDSIHHFLKKEILPEDNVTNTENVADKYSNEFNKVGSCILQNLFGVNDLYCISTNELEVKDINFDKIKNSSNASETLIREVRDAIANKIILNKFIDKIA